MLSWRLTRPHHLLRTGGKSAEPRTFEGGRHDHKAKSGTERGERKLERRSSSSLWGHTAALCPLGLICHFPLTAQFRHYKSIQPAISPLQINEEQNTEASPEKLEVNLWVRRWEGRSDADRLRQLLCFTWSCCGKPAK